MNKYSEHIYNFVMIIGASISAIATVITAQLGGTLTPAVLALATLFFLYAWRADLP